ncbi:type IV pilus inner membrane component PilO [Neisseria weaveri]|uniref:Pilus assembly protein n=1 Tax=Neisseria weaveri TaxID=28091 RepID=A0A3S5C3A7_9NEIS|nr:type 4a pilus biogenesis protein PilO [Neisseria weaveri]EGV35348.1 type IV pilus assembly protein PilO [Neisseria weaveri LMG 5135]SAY51234.1 pilus assembly protein [Neisseria weaveri]VEJ49946.1 pilus assembly protein [Neisseria weaveri]
MSAQNLKDLDLQNLYKLNLLGKIIIACLVTLLVIVLAYFAIFKSQLEELSTTQEKELELKKIYTQKSIQAASLNNLKAELTAIRMSFNVLLKQLPSETEIPNLIQELHQAGSKNGLRMDSLTPQAPVTDGPIQVLPHDIAITGKYSQISEFTRDVGSLSRIITLESLKINKHKDDKNNLLTMIATANTYKARTSEEITADIAAASAAAEEQ